MESNSFLEIDGQSERDGGKEGREKLLGTLSHTHTYIGDIPHCLQCNRVSGWFI